MGQGLWYLVFLRRVSPAEALSAFNPEPRLGALRRRVKKNQGKKRVLHLKGKTVVVGNITFESGDGTVEQGSGVKTQGEIKGATVEKK
jgi:hypothetical protein